MESGSWLREDCRSPGHGPGHHLLAKRIRMQREAGTECREGDEPGSDARLADGMSDRRAVGVEVLDVVGGCGGGDHPVQLGEQGDEERHVIGADPAATASSWCRRPERGLGSRRRERAPAERGHGCSGTPRRAAARSGGWFRRWGRRLLRCIGFRRPSRRPLSGSCRRRSWSGGSPLPRRRRQAGCAGLRRWRAGRGRGGSRRSATTRVPAGRGR